MLKWLLASASVSFPGSSMVEQEAVNFKVAGSNPARGAIQLFEPVRGVY